jgi:PAS domain S-box-containing protein
MTPARSLPSESEFGFGEESESTSLLGAIVDSCDDAIISKDLTGRIMSWNRSAERIFGYTAEEAIGQSITILIPADRLDEEPKILAQLQRGERVDHLETVRRRKDGTLLDISLTISPVRNRHGVIIGASKVARDITSRKRAEDALSAANAKFASVFNQSGIFAGIADVDGYLREANDLSLEKCGYTREEVLNRPFWETPWWRGSDAVKARIREATRKAAAGVPFREVLQYWRADGTERTVNFAIHPIRDETGKVRFLHPTGVDITEEMRAAQALRESEERFRQLADAMPQMVWSAQPDGHIDYYNARWYEFTGEPAEQFSSSSFASYLHPDDVARSLEAWYSSVRSGMPYQVEHRFRDRERRWRWFISRALPARNSWGRIVRWYGTTTEIDSQKRTEDELRRLNRDLEQFAYSASHDLQEPLRTIRIYSELFEERFGAQLEGEAVQFLNFLRSAAARMEHMVRDVLAYTQIARLEEPADEVDSQAALEAALENLSGSIAENDAAVIAESLPPVRMHRTHLQQLFQNLVGNAIKYRHPGRAPEIRVGARRDGTTWIFTVRDNGIGIEPQYREQIFGLFTRLHSADRYPGSGIGLATCRRIVDRCHGRIWVDSEPGRGSAFHFVVPA